jgi:hypothetical protein
MAAYLVDRAAPVLRAWWTSGAHKAYSLAPVLTNLQASFNVCNRIERRPSERARSIRHRRLHGDSAGQNDHADDG